MSKFYDVDSTEKAFSLVNKEELEAIYLYPIEFGGAEEMFNVGFVPVGVGEIKSRIDGVIEEMALEGLISSYDCATDYKEDSVVLSKITISAANDDGEVLFKETINIW